MKMQIYNFLVNRHDGIRSRYHKIHDNSGTGRKFVSYIYLLFLNFCYYFLFFRFLDKKETMAVYEGKNLPDLPESKLHTRPEFTVEHFVEVLSSYDVVSFDIFDTLIFRPFSDPTDLFYFLGERLELLDIKRIRMEQEVFARKKCLADNGHYEVTFAEIWKQMERETGIKAERGMALEQELEMKFCYPNSFMLKVFEALHNIGKKIIIISDMYLPSDFLEKLLIKNGYTGLTKLYVSCEYGKSKSNGELYRLVKNDFLSQTTFVHVGDNEHSDVKMAKICGFGVTYYPNINKLSPTFRSYDMSPMIGSAYRGIVNARLYRGESSYSMEYEYGFIYGGLFVLGYCHFIHEYCIAHSVEKILFLSRDGDVLKQVYDMIYPDNNTAYVYWSRAAATKLMAEFNSYDYFRRYLYHKVNQGISIREVLEDMELQPLLERLTESTKQILRPTDELTDKNVEILKRFIQSHFDTVRTVYQEGQSAAQIYYKKELAGVKHAAAVDIGWAGSGAMSLSFLVEQVWKIDCKITGIIAGTNTIHNAEFDAAEPFLQNEKLTAYLFSQSHNRDILKKHDPNKDYNIYWELFLSSPSKNFLGFSFTKGIPANICSDTGQEVMLIFGKADANPEGILEIRKGILDFISDYINHFKDFPLMYNISGRDAYAPMLAAAGRGEKYLKDIAKRFVLEKGI